MVIIMNGVIMNNPCNNSVVTTGGGTSVSSSTGSGTSSGGSSGVSSGNSCNNSSAGVGINSNSISSSCNNSSSSTSSSLLNAPRYGTPVPNRIFVGGITTDTSECDLESLFSRFGNVNAVKIINDRAGVPRGYGFITFDTEDEAKRVLREGDNLILKGRKLNVATAIKKQQNINCSTSPLNLGSSSPYNHHHHSSAGLIMGHPHHQMGPHPASASGNRGMIIDPSLMNPGSHHNPHHHLNHHHQSPYSNPHNANPTGAHHFITANGTIGMFAPAPNLSPSPNGSLAGHPFYDPVSAAVAAGYYPNVPTAADMSSLAALSTLYQPTFDPVTGAVSPTGSTNGTSGQFSGHHPQHHNPYHPHLNPQTTIFYPSPQHFIFAQPPPSATSGSSGGGSSAGGGSGQQHPSPQSHQQQAQQSYGGISPGGSVSSSQNQSSGGSGSGGPGVNTSWATAGAFIMPNQVMVNPLNHVS